jgi:predicted acylesterase/phospholipase RssA
VDTLEGPAEVAAFIRTAQAEWAGRGEGDELEAVLAGGTALGAEAELLASRFPMAHWFLLADGDAPRPDWLPPLQTSRIPAAGPPDALADAVATAVEALRQRKRADLVQALRQVDVLKDLPDRRLEWLADRIGVHRFEAGDVIVEEGGTGDGMYLVRAGEVGILAPGTTAAQDQLVGRCGRGEHFGEMALISGAPRSNTVVAALDAELLFLRKQDFDELLATEPRLSVRLSQVLSARLRRGGRAGRTAPRIIVCCGTAGDEATVRMARGLGEAIVAEVARDVLLLDLGPAGGAASPDRLAAALRAVGEGGQLEAALCEPIGERLWRLGTRDAPGLRPALPASRMAPLLEAAARAFPFVVVATAEWMPPDVLQRCLKQAGAVVLQVGDTADAVQRAASWREAVCRESPSVEPKITVAVEPSRAPRLDWLEAIARLDRPTCRLPLAPAAPGAARLYRTAARQLLGIAVGLALGGGGGRAAAHIGVLEVFEREGVPIDAVAGTSAGAIVGAAYAFGFSPAELLGTWQREFVTNPFTRYAFSKTAFFSPRPLELRLQRIFGEARLEALPLRYFAVATDLVSGEEVALDQGPLWEAVRASLSVPALLPPLANAGRYLVDGAVANNVPGDLLKRRGARLAIAVNVTPRTAFGLGPAPDAAHGWFGQQVRRLAPVREFLDAPSAIQIVMRAWEIEALHTVSTRAHAFDVHIHPAVDEVPTLEFRNSEPVTARGREAALAHLPDIRAKLRALTEGL